MTYPPPAPYRPEPQQPGPLVGGRAPSGPHLAPSPPPGRRGPSWGAVIAIVAASTVLAGLLGGVGGAVIRGGGEASATRTTAVSQGGAVERPSGSIAAIAAHAVPSVVTVWVDAGSRSGSGSGWVYDTSGHIVTNSHVVDAATRGSGTITVEQPDGTRSKAELVGRDVSYDLAVLKVDVKGVEPLPLGRSADVVVGDEVVAVGSPLGLDSTVTSGIVSAIERPVTAGESGQESFISAIQTDAAINPGNSGGPLLDRNGAVIGVNSAIAQMPGQPVASGNIGVGFAIPSDQVERTVDQLITTGKAVHPIIGVSLDRRYLGDGARVLSASEAEGSPVVTGGPADRAGIKPGDIIIEVDGKRIATMNQLIVRIRAKDVGDTVTLKVKRDGKEQTMTMTLEAAKD